MSTGSAEKEPPNAQVKEDIAAEPQPPRDDLPEIVVEAQRPWWHLNLKELWTRRELIYFLIRRDIKVRYRQTSLGMLWAILQPAFFTMIFTVFVGHLAGGSNGLFPIHVYSGFLAWTMFSSTINGASQSIVNSEPLISKIYFPRLAIPISVVGAQVVDFAVGCLGLVALMLFYRQAPDWHIVYLPLSLLLLMLAGFGTGTLFAALNVKYRDFRYLVPFLLQAWMFSTPSLFLPKTMTAGAPKLLLLLNPMTGLIELFRTATLGGAVPWEAVGCSAALIVVLAIAGYFYFRRVEDTFADII
jgi:lipopolysaccharide transport system permease protein